MTDFQSTPQPTPIVNAIVQVPFYGDTLDCLRVEDAVWLSLPQLCSNLGIDERSQSRRLRAKEWARVVMMTAPDARGIIQESWCVHLDTLPLWLATIDVSRVAEKVRPKLIAYQKECAKTLADHFYRRTAPVAPQPAAITMELVVAAVTTSVTSAMLQVMPAMSQALATVLREEMQVERDRANIAGSHGANVVRKHVREATTLIARPNDISHFRSVRTGLQQDLRAQLNWGGTGRGWDRFPMSRWNELIDALRKMVARASRESPSPQLSLIKSS